MLLTALALGVATILIAGAIYERLGRRRDARRVPAPGHMVDVGGRRLHLYCLGEGPVSVIFESGLAASSLNWRPVQQAVAPFARACAYDRAGYGWSDRARGPRTARAAADDLHRLLERAAIPPPYVLVGHSFGGYVAMVLAAEHLAEVVGLVLIDPITPDEWLSPDHAQRRLIAGGRLFSWVGAALAYVGVVRFLLNRTGEGGSELPGKVLALFGREADAVVRRVIGEVTKMPRELWPAVRAHWSRPAGFLTMAQHFRALSPSAVQAKAALAGSVQDTSRLRELPIVVVSAANCPEARVRDQQRIAELSRRGSHVRATLGGHWVHLDQPAIIVSAIRALASRDERGDGPDRPAIFRSIRGPGL